MGMAMRHRLPFAAAWAGDALVVSHVPPDLSNTIATGDMILAIDGETVGDITRLLRNRISAANEGWFRHRALGEILSRRTNEPANLELRRPNGTTYGARLNPVPAYPPAAEPELEKIAELEPGIWYVDLDRITDEDFTQSLLPLIAADGVVFDLRGYPGNLSTIIIAHLIDEPVTCAQWHIPIVRRPDRETMEFQFSNWIVEPRLPRLTGNVAFIIDGRAISYAETYMGIIEHYDLAEIVGERTAGTNGNINVIRLPDGSSIVFTGMKVLKHDGTQHHGVGIEPTVPVSRTIEGIAAGRDELLERAIEIVRDDD
jgi:C-terminal processing protease CtpA/Prc